MVRMWNVSPDVMCRQHLLGEHVEMHMVVGSINRGKSITGYTSNGLLDTRHIQHRLLPQLHLKFHKLQQLQWMVMIQERLKLEVDPLQS